MAGRKTFTAGEVLQAADVNDFLMDQSVMVFAGTAARGSAIPSPSEGMVTYRSDDDVVEVYNGSSFVPVGPGQILQVLSTYVSGNFATTSLTPVDLTGFTLDITPSSTSNKIMVMFALEEVFNDATGGDCDVFINRGATAIAGEYVLESSGSNDQGSIAGHHLDSPNTVSTVTYKLQVQAGNTGTANYRRGSFTLMEVSG